MESRCLLWDGCEAKVTWNALRSVFSVENCTCVGQTYETTDVARSHIGFLASASKEWLIGNIRESGEDWYLVTSDLVRLAESEA